MLDPLTGQWSEIIGDETLRFRELPEELEIELYLEDRRVLLKPDPAQTEREEDQRRRGIEQYVPHVLIYSSGDMTPFEVHIVRDADDTLVAIRSDLTGTIEFIDTESGM